MNRNSSSDDYYELMNESDREPMNQAFFHKRALWISTDSLVSVSRTTTSDVMCIVNTSQATPTTFDLPRYKTLKPIATLPYKINSKPKLPDGTTDFSALRNVELKSKNSNELKKERDMFFNKLRQERLDKTSRESASVVKIQAIVRGYLVRPQRNQSKRNKNITIPILVPGVPISNEIQLIQNELCSYAQMLGLKPIPGLSLEARSKHNRRREKIILAASIRISTFFKLTLIALRARKTADIAKQNIHERAANKIQKFFRYVHKSIGKRKRQNIKRENAVLKIQTRFRIFHDFRRVRELRRKKYNLQREHDARIIIYRNIIQKNHEHLLSKLKLRKEEKLKEKEENRGRIKRKK